MLRLLALVGIVYAVLLPATLRADVNLTTDQSQVDLSANAGTTDPVSVIFTLTNNGSSSTAFVITPTTTSGGSWLRASAADNVTTLDPGASVVVTVFADPTGLEAVSEGFAGLLTITGGGSTVQVVVTFSVQGIIITVTPNTISLTLATGQKAQLLPANQQGVHVDASGTVLASPSTISGGAQWLAVPGFDPNNGNQGPLDFEVDLDATGLAPGQYLGSILVSCVAGSPCLPKPVAVALTVAVPLQFLTSSLPAGTVGESYSKALSVTGVPPYAWSVVGGVLPPGLSISPTTGTIAGVPTQAGSSTFTLAVVDHASAVSTMTFTLEVNSSVSALVRSGILSQVASGGGWKTSIYLVNTSSKDVPLVVNLWSDSGGALNLPLTVTQLGQSQSLTASSVSETVGPNATLLIESASQSAVGLTGWAEVQSSSPVTGYGVFHYTSVAGIQSEGTVPLEANFQPSFVLPFDNVNGFQAGVALANLAIGQPASVTATIWDESGTQVGVQSLSLPAGGHKSFILAQDLPATATRRGIIQFSSDLSGGLTGLGLRINPSGGFTSIPKNSSALGGNAGGPVLSRSGVLSQVASGGGWKTSIYLVNTTVSAGSVAVQFWDNGGLPLPLALTVTQSGVSQSLSAASVNAVVAPNATVLIESSSSAAIGLAGWAEVLSSGQLSGYGVFHYVSTNGTNSEGTVPLDTTFAPTFILPYDNLNQFGTGAAFANLVAAQQAPVSATIWDDRGTIVGTQALTLAAGGHDSAALSTSFPATANRRGIIEFSNPLMGNLTGLGLRINPSGGFTSIPKLQRP